MHFLNHLLTTPTFKDEEKAYQVYLLNIILITLIVIPVPFILYLLTQKPADINRIFAIITLAEIINISLFLMLKRGYVRQVSTAHIITLWLIFAVSSVTTTSVQSVAYMLGNGLVITMTVILLGESNALAMTFLVIVQGGAMVYAELHGWTPLKFLNDPLYIWAIVILMFVAVLGMQIIAAKKLRTALARARTSEERYRFISQVSSDYTFSIEVDSQYSMHLNWVAGAFEQITGYTFEEYITNGGWPQHLHPEDAAADSQSIAVLKTNQPTTTEVRTFKKNGDVCWVRVYSHPVWDEEQNRLTGIVGAVQEISKQKQSGITLTQERDLLQTFLDNIPDSVYFKDTESRFMRINKAQANFLKLNSPLDAIGKTDLDFFAPDLAQQFLEEEKQILASGESIFNRIEFNPTSEGQPRWLTATKVPVKDSTGRILGTIGISRDITKQKQTDAMLAYERDILQIFMDNIPDQVYFKDRESRFVRINQGQARFLGIENPQDAIGKTDLDFQQIELAHEFLAEEKHIIETGQPVLSHIEYHASTGDGKPLWLSSNKVPAKNELGEIIGIIGISFDITEQKLAEKHEQHRRNMLEKVIQLGQYVTEIQDINTTLQRIWQSIRQDLDFDRLGIFLYDPLINTMNGTYGTNNQGEIVDETHIHINLNQETQETISFKTALREMTGVYLTHSYEADHQIPDGHIMDGVKDHAAISAWAGDKPIGVLCVDNVLSMRPITDEQLDALRLFAGYAGLAIENARLNDALQKELRQQLEAEEREVQRRHTLEKVTELGKHVTEVADLSTTLKKVWHAIHDDLDFDRLAIFLYNAKKNSVDSVLGTDTHGNMQDTLGVSFPIEKQSTFNQVLSKPDGFYLTNNFDVDHNVPEGHEMHGVKSYAAVAVWAGNKPIAIIAVDQFITQRTITVHQIEALRLFAGYVGLAIENARLKDEIENELIEQKQAEETEQRRRMMMEKVVQLGKQVTEITNLETSLERIWRVIHEDLDFDRVGIFLYNAKDDLMDRALGTDAHGKIEKMPLSIPVSIFRAALETSDGYHFSRDYSVEYNIPEGHEMYGVKEHIEVAAWIENKPVAMLAVDQFITQRPITVQQIESLRLFAGYAGLAIENSHLNEAIQKELDEQKLAEETEQHRRIMMEKVIQLGKQVTGASDFGTTLSNIWHSVRYDLSFDRVGIFIYNSQTNMMKGAYGTDREGNIWDARHVQFDLDSNTLFSKVLSSPDGLFFSRDFEKEFNLPSDHDMAGVKYAAVVAVWAGDKPTAIISVDQLTSGHSITEEQLEALRLFAGYAGLAIENSRLKDAIEKELVEQKQAEEIEQRRRMMMEKVVELGKQVTEVNDFETTLRKIWQGLRYELDFDRVGLFIYDAEENSMTGAYGTDRTGNIWDAWHVKIGLSDTQHIDDSVVFHKMLDRPGGFYSTIDYEGEFNLPSDHPMAGVKHYAVVAVWAGDKPVAFISVDQLVTGRVFSDEQLEALRLFAGYAGLAISNSRLNTALEDELTQRQTFITELEKKNAELERFTYTVSHDLKSPLVTITGFLGYLEQDALSGNMEKVRSNINRISSAAHKMQALLNDLLELSRIGRLMNPPEDIALVEVIHEAVDRVRGKLDELNAIIEIQRDLPSISGDRVRLIEVVQNLIENAAKYSDPKIQPRIEIGAQDDKSDAIATFYVRDNGIGIAPKYHENIFGLFNKLNATSEGTGIGLTLVKRIIEVHGGNIWVESELGNGATFYFTLPRAHTKE